MNPYGAVVALRNRLYDRGTFAVERLQWPVISIGNLRVGGAGKTPFVIALGKLLQERKRAFTVLSRGYRRADTRVRLVETTGAARDFGDEPLLIARRLLVPVVVGADRFAAGQHAERLLAGLQPAHGDSWLHLLDDGFQHRRLARDFDIVLVTETDSDDRLLPLGRLREPLTSLARADAVVVDEKFDAGRLPAAARGERLWRVRRRLELPADLPPRVVAFAGVARPERFFAEVRAAGVAIVSEVAFPDHHVYGPQAVDRLNAEAARQGAAAFVTTEKDAINLEGATAVLARPLHAVPLRMELLDPAPAVDALLARCRP